MNSHLIEDIDAALHAMPREHLTWRLLALLDGALRLRHAFIEQNPAALFQCMWNTGWWHDCSENAEYYEQP